VTVRYKNNRSGIFQDITALWEHVDINTKVEAGEDVNSTIV
jgi:hypothetical protein